MNPSPLVPMNVLTRIQSTMKTQHTRFVPSAGFGHDKEAEDGRTSNVSSPPAVLNSAPKSRAPAVLCRCLLVLLIALVLAAAVPAAHAAGPPEAMTYQGFVVDANGNPLAANTPANYPIIFSIYPTPTGGSSLWSEQQIVTVDKGNFSVILGEGTAVGSDPRPLLSTVLSTNGADRYIQLSVTIGTAPPSPMLPRLRLLPSPYAFLATSANSLVSPNGVPVIRYANSRVEVAGDLNFSGGISGDGAGLTGLSAAQIGAGTIADQRLSANVALRLGGNAFSGNQTMAGNVGIGTLGTAFPLTIGNNTLGDKISLYGQSGNTYGFGIQGGTLQIHTTDAASDIAFGYGSSAAMTETMRIKGNGNVGIGLNNPSGKLTVNGGVRARGGAPGGGGGNDNGYAFTGNGGDNDSGMFSSADGQVEFYGNSVERMRIASSGNIGINTPNPAATLDVNGSIRANSVTVNGTVSATTFSGTFNGEKPPQTYTVGPGSNLNSWRELPIDTAALLGDADGGRIKVLLRNHYDKIVRTASYEFYAENDTDNFGLANRQFMSLSSYGTPRYFRLGTTDTGDIASDYNWFWIRNYRSGIAFGGNDSPPENFANRYKFWILVAPWITATVIVYDQ